MAIRCTLWKTTNVLWKDANWKWIECQLVQEIISSLPPVGVPGDMVLPPWLEEPTTAQGKIKRKKFIRLICKVKNGPTYNDEKEIKDDIKISIDDIRLVTKAVHGIDIEITR